VTDVNEEIVRQYFELKGYFVQTDVLYLKPKGKTGKESSGYGDIDLVVINPKTGDKAIVGVSGWHRERITPSYVEGWEGRLFSHLHPLALEKACEVLSCKSKDFRKILVISRMGSKEESRKEFEQKARQQGIDEIIEFPTILKELISLTKTEPSYDSEVLQTLRLLKIYDLLKIG
jgi:hypothetical protein